MADDKDKAKKREDKAKKDDNKVDDSYKNKDTGINRAGKRSGKYADGKKKPEKEKSINEMGGSGRDPNVRNDKDKEDVKDPNKQEDNRGRRATDNRGRRREDDRKTKKERNQEERDKKARDEKVEKLRSRRKAVQHYTDIAENSDDPLKEINWADKNLKSKDRRLLRNKLENRGFSDREVFKHEKDDMNRQIRKNKKDVAKNTAGVAGDVASAVGSGGLTAVFQIPSILYRTYKIRKGKKSTKELKKSMKMRRFMLILPTLLIVFGVFIAGWLLLVTGSQFVGTMLSHPEAVRELYEAGALGDAMYMGNVTEDVIVDGEVVVKGNPNAQPGCFVYNGVWYCGGCLETGGGVQASDNSNGNTSGEDGDGETIGNLIEPMKTPYKFTSNFGNRSVQGQPGNHKGIDLVGQDPERIVYAADGGVVTRAKGVCAPNSGFYENKDGECGGWGNNIVVKHDSPDYEQTLYAHLDYVNVEEGQKVTQGQELGVQGHTGNSTAPHLHFEVYVGGTQVDPRGFISFPSVGVIKQ